MSGCRSVMDGTLGFGVGGLFSGISEGWHMVFRHLLNVFLMGLVAIAFVPDTGGSLGRVVYAGTVEPTVERAIPEPMADHPGNVYVRGQTVWVRLPESMPEGALVWRALDDAGLVVAKGRLEPGRTVVASRLRLGELGVGWYRVEFMDAGGQCVQWTTAAVLERLAAPTPQDSPICVDSATAWFAKDRPTDQARLASLAALAGVNWIRDRLTWSELEPRAGAFTTETTSYDTAARIQTERGLKVLQVFHGTPSWAQDRVLDGDRAGGRFPRDLRAAWRFCKAMAERFRGTVHAWEPWNEANIDVFGGHTVDEMCSYQKAAYLGFKAGDPDVIVGWNVYTTLPTEEHTRGLIENEAWAYFDTYNIHTYEWAHDFARLWGPARRASGGKPIWVTEADRGLKYAGPEPWCELSRDDELRKARYIAQEYASSLYAGAVRHFHFILGHYYEKHNGVQFGLLRKDMTPRPAYVALAAVGRLLAGGRCLGRWEQPGRPDVHVIAFRARPDGRPRDVLVAWVEKAVDWPGRDKTRVAFSLPTSWQVESVWDYLGRRLEAVPAELDGRAVFVVLAAGQTRELQLTRPSAVMAPTATVCPVVLQVQVPRRYTTKISPIPWSQGYEYRVPAGRVFGLHLYAYNFTENAVGGAVRVERLPDDVVLSPRQWEITIGPMDRTGFDAALTMPAGSGRGAGTVKLVGDFGSAGRSVLAFRIQASDVED